MFVSVILQLFRQLNNLDCSKTIACSPSFCFGLSLRFPCPLPKKISSRILGFHMTSRPPCWCPKQRKSGHIGAPTKSSGNLTLLLCKRFLLFSLKNMAVDHVSENQQYSRNPCLFRNITQNHSREYEHAQ